MSSLTPAGNLADIRDLVDQLPAVDAAARDAALAREPQLLKPPGALGRLEALAAWLAGWQGRHPPQLARVGILVFAGNHGVTAQGVSAYPASVTAAMVESFAAGRAAINQLARVAGAELQVHSLRLDRPTADFTRKPAMGEAECVDAFNAGLTAPDEDLDLLALGEMGIGNTTAAAAICAALFGGEPSLWAGPGTGLDSEGVALKAVVIARALAEHAGHLDDSLEVLVRLGGFEIAAKAGAITAGRLRRTPILLDGFVATAAAAILHRLRPDALDHCQAAHVSAEPGHGRLLAGLKLAPLLDLGMRLGEASGAAVAVPILRAAVACHSGMATFAEAGVAGKTGS